MRSVLMIMTAAIFLSCSSNRYAATNKDYKRQAKQLAKEIKKYPLEGKRKDWVGHQPGLQTHFWLSIILAQEQL